MLDWLRPQFNTGDRSPDIENMLQRFDYKGLTDRDDPINRIARQVMRDDFYKKLSGRRYLNIYQFRVNGKPFHLCDRAVENSVETRRHVCILATEKYFPLGFEITTNTNEEFINNDCESAEVINACDVRIQERDEYEGQKSILLSVLPHCESFSTDSYPVCFFSFPEDHILGYHISGRQIAFDEFDSAVSLLLRFP